MSAKQKKNTSKYVGQLGKTFNFTWGDLAANRVGYMTRPQMFGFTPIDRLFFGWIFRIPPLSWVKPRKVVKARGKVKSKNYNLRVVNSFGGGEEGGGGFQIVLEKRTIQFMTADDGLGFYVTEKQYNALPQNIEMTLYYEPEENRIVSVEPPYAKE